MTDAMPEHDVYQITFERGPTTEQHITDAQRVDDWPSYELHIVLLDPDKITVEATPEGIRWLYDMLHQLKREWRTEGEQWDADTAEEMARTIWDAVGGDLPDQQRTRRMTDGGETPSGEVKHHYIGENKCKKATCTMVQEFPDGASPYCLIHALEMFTDGRA